MCLKCLRENVLETLEKERMLVALERGRESFESLRHLKVRCKIKEGRTPIYRISLDFCRKRDI